MQTAHGQTDRITRTHRGGEALGSGFLRMTGWALLEMRAEECGLHDSTSKLILADGRKNLLRTMMLFLQYAHVTSLTGVTSGKKP